MKIWGLRFSLIGDIIMSLPTAQSVLDEYKGNAAFVWSIAKKCQQARMLFESQPWIKEIKISDLDEDLGPQDQAIIQTCDRSFNVKPPHPQETDWYNYRSCIEETALQAGIDPKRVSGANPSLFRYWKRMPIGGAIAIFPFAGYGLGLERSPSAEWWHKLIAKLVGEFEVFHFGMDNEPTLSDSSRYTRYTHGPFHVQIMKALDCRMAIGTDSGSMWCVGAYGEIPQINLLTNWLPNHHQNHLALAPASPKALNLFAEGGCSNININDVLKAVYDQHSCR